MEFIKAEQLKLINNFPILGHTLFDIIFTPYE